MGGGVSPPLLSEVRQSSNSSKTVEKVQGVTEKSTKIVLLKVKKAFPLVSKRFGPGNFS